MWKSGLDLGKFDEMITQNLWIKRNISWSSLHIQVLGKRYPFIPPIGIANAMRAR